MQPDIHVSCAICSELIAKHPRISYRQYMQQKFCSRECRAIWQSAMLRGENNYNYKHGNSRPGRLSPDRRWAAEVKERDEYTCVKCGYTGNDVHADHVKSYRDYIELRLDIDNGRTLCREPHRAVTNYRPYDVQ